MWLLRCIWLLSKIIFLDSCLTGYKQIKSLPSVIHKLIMSVPWILLEFIRYCWSPVNNSGQTSYYQLTIFPFYQGFTSCLVWTNDLPFSTTMITIFMMGFNLHWNTCDLQSLTTKTIIPIMGCILWSKYTYLQRSQLFAWLILAST